jgi:hypothetical protein
MKLIFCLKCNDVVLLAKVPRHCKCKKSGGKYHADGLQAEYWGEAIPIGFKNSSLVEAVCNQPESGMGERFEAFVIPKECPTMKKIPSTSGWD